jgi:hypothetical protein
MLRVFAAIGSRGLVLMGWRMAERAQGLTAGDALEFACKLDENTHPEFGGLQLMLCDLRKKTAAAS